MVTTLLLLLTLTAVGLLIVGADGEHRVNLTLRWAYTGSNYVIQRRSVFGIWIPYTKATYPDAESAEGAIAQLLGSHAENQHQRFGPPRTTADAEAILAELERQSRNVDGRSVRRVARGA